MENKASGKKFSWHEVFSQVVISGFTGFLAGVYGYEQGYSESMTMVFSGLGGAFGGAFIGRVMETVCPFIRKRKTL